MPKSTGYSFGNIFFKKNDSVSQLELFKLVFYGLELLKV